MSVSYEPYAVRSDASVCYGRLAIESWESVMRQAEVLADLRLERQGLVDAVRDADLDLETPADGWSIHDTVSHLWSTDEAALAALVEPEFFRDTILANAIADPNGFVDASVDDRRGLGKSELLASWDATFAALLTALDQADPAAKVLWFGPPMNPTSFATARVMEYWAHGQDIFDTLGATRDSAAGTLRHICHLGFRTRGFAYLIRGLTPPEVEVGVRLGLPDGSVYQAGSDGPELITGSAEDFCLVVTQRRHPADTDLVAEGKAAEEWLAIAQCFAGPPGKGRDPK